MQGEPGCDVCGKPVKPKRSAADIELDDTVARSADAPGVVIAKVPGRVVFERNRLSISEAFELRGDVDFESGSIESSVDVQIGGMVHDGFEGQEHQVGSPCEAPSKPPMLKRAPMSPSAAASWGATADTLRAAGDIVAKFGNEANLHAGGGVSIQKELMNCEVRTEGKLLASPRHGDREDACTPRKVSKSPLWAATRECPPWSLWALTPKFWQKPDGSMVKPPSAPRPS